MGIENLNPPKKRLETNMAEKNKNNIVVLGGVLGLICAIAACVLAFTSNVTKEAIQHAAAEKNNKAIKQVLDGFDNMPDKEAIEIVNNGRQIIFYPGKKDGKIIGFAAQASSPKGYGGEVKVMLGISPEGNIKNVIVIKHNETPGLGSVVTNRAIKKTIFDVFAPKKISEGLPPNPVLDSFNNLSVVNSPWQVDKDGGVIHSITGATVSSRAVTDAVNTIAAAFKENKTKLLEGQ